MKKRLWTILLLFVFVITFTVPLSTGIGGNAFEQPKEITAKAAGTYDKLAVELAGATAFDDALNAIKVADDPEEAQKTFKKNIKTLTTGTHFGNVGIFVGLKGTSKNSDVWSVFQSKVTISNEQIKAYDKGTNKAFTKYKVFGGAVQKLNTRSQKVKGSSASMEKTLNTMSAAGAKLSGLGTQVLASYNPAPLLLAFFDVNNLNTHPDNKLVQMVNGNPSMKGIYTTFGTKTTFGRTGISVSLSFLIMCLGAFLLLITSVLMTLINGRAAGENIRKMMVKILIGCVGIPLLAKMLDSGISFLNDVTIAQANAPTSNYVEQNLNFADWYAIGFAIPTGTDVYIDKDGEFVFTPEAVRAINTYTYKKVWGVKNPTDEQMMTKMEEYYNMYKGVPMGVGFSEPIHVSDGQPWYTKNFYATLANLGENKELLDGVEYDASGDNLDMANIGYYAANGLQMTSSSDGWLIRGLNTRYGISPIAATNLMRTSFTGSTMTVNTNSVMGSVAFDVDNGISATGSTNMPALVRFAATLSIVIAAVKGIFTIFAAGFGSTIAGGMKTAFGQSAGFGQAFGGVVALIFGVFGTGLIMTISFTMVDALYGLMESLLSGDTYGTDILEPIKDVVEGIPLLGPLLGDILKTGARFILSILCMLTLPKFGGIPVTLFCQHMADLPQQYAERAQQIENKFTGDFRGGSGRVGGMGAVFNNMANQAANAGSEQARGMKQGLAAIGGAIGGLALNKGGEWLGKQYKDADIGEDAKEEKSVSNPGEEADTTPDASDVTAAATAAELAEEEEKKDESSNVSDKADANTSKSDETERNGNEDSVANIENNDVDNQTMEGNDLKEVEKEDTHDYDEGDSMSVSDTDTEQISDESISDSVNSDNVTSDSSLSTDNNSSETGFVSDQSSLNESTNEQNTDMENQATASIHSDHDSTVETPKDNKSMSKSNNQQQSSTTGSNGNKVSNATRTASGANTGKSMNNGSKTASETGKKTDKQTLTREQRHNRNMQALAKGLQAAGSHTTGGQAVAGVIAGAVHIAGSAVGAQNVTGQGVNAVRNYKQRQNDIRQGLPAGYTERQQQANQTQTERPKTAQTQTQYARRQQQQIEQARQAEIAEEMAREAEEAARRASDR